MSKKYKIGDVVEVKIEKIVPGGFGLAFAENLTVFTSLSAAGDRLQVKIIQLKGKTAFAEIVEIIEPSTDRVEPKCPYFGHCGGCDFQHLSYKAQLAAKVAIVSDCLSRIGKIYYEKEIEIIESPRYYDYRARAAWHIDTRRKKIGYFQRNSHTIIDVETCPILTPELRETLTELRETVEWGSFWGEVVEIEATSGGKEVSIYSAELIEPTESVSFTAAGENFAFDATIFFQGNPFLIESLIDAATKNAAGENALDLYCGVGLFTLPLTKNFARVTGIEGHARAVQFALQNIEIARTEKAEVLAENVGEWLTDNRNDLENIDFVLLDPPRVGAEKGVIENLLKIAPKEISYVSCDPATLARDLSLLTENYSIESITALDLFPQNHHVETVVRLKRL